MTSDEFQAAVLAALAQLEARLGKMEALQSQHFRNVLSSPSAKQVNSVFSSLQKGTESVVWRQDVTDERIAALEARVDRLEHLK